jgi:hypothetical protein
VEALVITNETATEHTTVCPERVERNPKGRNVEDVPESTYTAVK